MNESRIVNLDKMLQVGFAVRDADKTAAIWSQIFGFSNWDTTYLDGYDGKNNPWKAKIVKAHMGFMEYELIQPVVGRIAQSRLLESFGEGIHHIKFQVPIVKDETNKLRNRSGFRVIWQNDTLSYIEVPGGVIFEFVKPPETLGKGDVVGGPEIVNLRNLVHVGIIVHDIDKVIKEWSDAFGLTIWNESDFTVTENNGNICHNRILTTQINNIAFEFMQPVLDSMPQKIFLEKHGDGIHHLSFFVIDLEEVIHKLITCLGFELIIDKDKDRMSFIKIPGGLVIELKPLISA